MFRALVVADDGEVGERAEATLRLEWPDGIFDRLESGARAIVATREHPPDLVLLDLGLSTMDGIDALASIRRFSSVPIIAIARGRDDRESWKRGVELGADEYVISPFSPLELLARTQAVLVWEKGTDTTRGIAWRPNHSTAREMPAPSANLVSSPRTGPFSENDRSIAAETVREAWDDGYLSIDLAACRVHVGGEPVCLTIPELKLFARLVAANNRVVPLRCLLAELWGHSEVHRTEYLRVYIRRLRERIEPDPGAPRYLLAEQDGSYRFAG